jgi:hypothetical protein
VRWIGVSPLGMVTAPAVPAAEPPAIVEPAPQSELKVEGAAAAGAANASNASDASDAAKTDTSK